MATTYENREIFIKEFFGRIILRRAIIEEEFISEYKKKINEKQKDQKEESIIKEEETTKKEKPVTKNEKEDKILEKLLVAPIPEKKIIPIINSKRPITFNKQLHKVSPILRPNPPVTMGPPALNMPSAALSGVENNLVTLSKLMPLIRDPAVISIECTGAGQPIYVNAGGAIKSTNIALSNTEIVNIMEELSAKTKIPLINGLFKAVIGRLIITATISDFIDTKFIISKRNPFNK